MNIFNKTETQLEAVNARSITLLRSFVGYLVEYSYFTTASFFLSILILFKEGFDTVHAHNPPDTIFLWAFFYKLFGKKFVFDHHDLSPEMYLARYKKKKDVIYRCLLFAEKLTCRLADRVIATNNSYKQIVIRRNGINPEKIYVVRNGPDLNRVILHSPEPKLKAINKTIIGYVGNLNPQDGVDYLLRALYYLKNHRGRNDFLAILIGRGDDLLNLKKLSSELDLVENIMFTGFISDKDMLRYLSTADICVSPDPYNYFTNNSTWVKVLEYMALGKPIVAFDLKETRYSAQEAALYARPNDECDFAKAIEKLMDSPDLREKMGEYGWNRIKNELSWDHVSKNLLSAYSFLEKTRKGTSKNIFHEQ
ncbi:MAG: glycosyltransferase family 4 protein [Candidatus Hodarchaeota archaeon]